MANRTEQQIHILEGTIKVFNRKGMKFTMDDLAHELSMSKKTIYVCYDDKKELFVDMVNYLFDNISEKKRETVLYKNASADFLTMALDNAFRTDETNIHSEPLKEYVHLVSVGEIGIYKHKSQRKYYVSATKQADPYYEAYGITLKMFQTDFYLLRSYYMVNKNFVFESFELEIIFRQIFNLN